MITTQQQYNVLQRPVRHLDIKIDLLSENDIVLDSLEGIAISGSLDISATSTYRRIGNIKMVLKDKQLIPSPNSKIWFNRRVRVWTGLRDYNGEIIWFNHGRFAYSEISLDFNRTEKTIEMNLLDYMAFLDGTLGGRLSNEVNILPEGSSVNDAIRTVVSSLGRVSLDTIEVNGSPALIPYEITQQPNSTVYDLVKQLVELYMGYEFYFDIDGYFRVQKIKQYKTDSVLWDFTQNHMNLSVDYNRRLNLGNVKNSIYVWGRKLDDGTQIKWVYKNRFARNTVTQRNAISNKEKGDICHVYNEDNSYMWNGQSWELLDFTVVPIFNVESIGEKKWAYSEVNIFTEDQARLRGEYELREYSNFAETISFNCIPILMLDVNRIINLNVPELDIFGRYLVQSFNIPLNINDTMHVQAIKIYE